MSLSDEKSPGVNARESSRLRSTLGSEPGSGYAFHDEARVERIRSARPAERSTRSSSNAPHKLGLSSQLGHVSVPQALPARDLVPELKPHNDQSDATGSHSWPPLPQVPEELEGSAGLDADARSHWEGESLAQCATTPVALTPAPVAIAAGGAIWQALPSVVHEGLSEHEAPDAELAPPAAGSSRPTSLRSSALEPGIVRSSAGGDARIVRYDPLVERGDWEQLRAALEREADLSPALELLLIIAQRETLKAEDRQAAAQLSRQGIATLARALQLPADSPTALLLSKRLLRRNPGWVQVKRPSTGLSLGMLLLGLATGAGMGWLATWLLL